ncbi:MAG TPA: hypothetical protein VKZ81_11440 [Pseudonocardia sp.]|uniref:hypothetical protein n=1 Tax=Pseudonocardia sp. TaxID=60912 RepID=UPI002B4B9476|nr:hypothetical protein [Pseudonocardia sp.]HLU56065.1 hypothetical protein [Pseudonocardia sp.]
MSGRREQLAEVWGDVVDVAHLWWSVVLGCALGLPAYLLAGQLFARFTEPQLARTYALLVGLVACLVAGAICARLFAPKRDLVEQQVDDAARGEAVAELVAESGVLGDLADLPEATRRELRELGIDGLFTDQRPGEPVPEAEQAVRR